MRNRSLKTYGLRALSILFVLIALMILFNQFILPIIYRSRPTVTIHAFWNSLYKNDQNTALKISDDSKHLVIENWIENHEIITCPNSLAGGATSVGSYDDDMTWHGSISDSCILQTGEPYCLRVNDIIVEKRNFGWLIIDWAEITESCEID